MDFLQGKIKPIYFKYLGAAFGSALITSIYAIADTAMVGQYQGPDGTAALAVVAPIWNILNRQILKYLGTNALAVYGIIVNISSFVQCCAYSVGQASQPIISMNLVAKLGGRIKQTLRYALGTAAFFSIVWTVLSLAAPMLYVRIFMTPTEEIFEIAPNIIRSYSISFLLLPLNVFSTYYFQALMKPTAAFIISVARGLVLSGILIFILPVIAGANAIWFAMPITELVIAVFVVLMIRYTRQLPTERKIS